VKFILIIIFLAVVINTAYTYGRAQESLTRDTYLKQETYKALAEAKERDTLWALCESDKKNAQKLAEAQLEAKENELQAIINFCFEDITE